MAGPPDILRRFRPAGAPGAAAVAGVPADRVAEAAAELGPVLDLLAEVEAACAELREAGRRDADATLARAREQAAGVIASARMRAEGERAATAARARAEAEGESARRLAGAERDAAEVLERAERRMPGYVARVVAMVRNAGLDAPTSDGAGAER
jgi:hypothetical protein